MPFQTQRNALLLPTSLTFLTRPLFAITQIKATSPLTHNISGTAKAAFQAALAHWLWGNPATFKGVMGILAVLGGSLAYTKVRMEEGRLPVTQEDSEKGAPKK